MSKEKEGKSTRKVAAKTLKEKRADKATKKEDKRNEGLAWVAASKK